MTTTPALSAMTIHRSNDYDDSNESIQKLHQLQTRLDEIDQLEMEMHKYLDRLIFMHLKPKVATPTQSLLRHAQILLRHSAPSFKRAPVKKWEDAEISHMKTRLSRLVAQREETAAEVSRIRASKSACRRFPPEIWSTIFQFCLPEDDPYVKPDVNSAPLLLCSVSQLWRDIAISTPFPLEPPVYRPKWEETPHERVAGSMAQTIWQPSPVERWERLHLNMADESLYQSILDANLPNLHTVEFSNKCTSGALRIRSSNAPNLRSVSFLTAPIDPSPALLPWEQLHSLSSRYWTDVDSHLEVISRCPNLEHTRVHVLHGHCVPETPTAPLRMSNLKSLEVVALNGNAMSLLLERLEVPLLEELTLIVPEESMEYGTSGWPKESVLSLVERSQCSTLKVHLHGIDLSATGGGQTLRM
ncbi:hypothetical protein FA13DRAFT_1710350 [Coprinellus micaceus]|uniref:F-box domain-containing protein n=1 Tax=Coprinellus micaceus TaxID=71717 RepID=A0A4Y7T8L4_COPMI|nr:hypothetical protein FA13DRAFT_1710350 [Coprinellus micaceus]